MVKYTYLLFRILIFQHNSILNGFFSLPGTPIMFTLSTMYSWLLVGPMALLGLLIVLLLYPIMVGLKNNHGIN